MKIENIFPMKIGLIKANEQHIKLIHDQFKDCEPYIRPLLQPTWGDSTLSSHNACADILSKFNLTALREFVDINVQKYFQIIAPPELLQKEQSTLLIKRESWINFSSKYGFQERHNHIPYNVKTSYLGISGAYYLNTNGKDGYFEFCPIDSLQGMFGTHPIEPENGNLILFRSELNHRVSVNLTENERISVSFNYMIS